MIVRVISALYDSNINSYMYIPIWSLENFASYTLWDWIWESFQQYIIILISLYIEYTDGWTMKIRLSEIEIKSNFSNYHSIVED